MEFSTYLLHLFSRPPCSVPEQGRLPGYGRGTAVPIGGDAPGAIIAFALLLPLIVRYLPPDAVHICAIGTAAFTGWFWLQWHRVNRQSWLRWLVLSLVLSFLSVSVIEMAKGFAASAGRQSAGGQK